MFEGIYLQEHNIIQWVGPDAVIWADSALDDFAPQGYVHMIEVVGNTDLTLKLSSRKVAVILYDINGPDDIVIAPQFDKQFVIDTFKKYNINLSAPAPRALAGAILNLDTKSQVYLKLAVCDA
jgi:hypothetical protein